MREALMHLEPGIRIRAGADLDWESATIVLEPGDGPIAIEVPNDLSKALAQDPLIDQVQSVFQLLTEEHIKNLAKVSRPKR
jgi:hypothetical protein